jgi:AcrR family transcriptional regulator
MHDAGSAGHTPRTDTRSRVQKVALELFAEQGYEKTSLREIAERLSVTKAALYYHFKSKEDIVHSFTDDYFAGLDHLLDWAKEQPRTDEARREILDRYVSVVLASSEVFRFLEQNRASVQSMEAGKERLARARVRLDALVDVLVGCDLHVLPAASGRLGQTARHRPRDGHRPDQLSPAASRPGAWPAAAAGPRPS